MRVSAVLLSLSPPPALRLSSASRLERMSYTFSSGAYGTGSGSATRVYGEHGIRGLDDAEEADREDYRRRQNEGAEALMARTQMAPSGRFAQAASAAASGSANGLASSSDNLGHFRQSVPSLSQNPRALSAASLEHLEGYKVRDLFASHAQRTDLTRAEVHKETQSEVYVPRQPRLLSSADFAEFSAAAAAYAETMANTTANARAKAAARAAKLGGITGATAAGGGGGAAAVVAAATASAVAASDPLVPRPLPLLPTSHDPFEVARAQATESYLQEIWSENRAKEAADERLRKHISKLVGEWSGRLARFEEEVARRQEDTYYAKFRRAENAKLAQAQAQSASQDEKQHEHHDHDHSDPSHSHSQGFSSPEAAKAAALAAHRSFYSDQFSGHHKAEAWTAMLVNKKEHQDAWPLGVNLGVVDPKANRVNKEALRRKKAMMEHQMAHSICASTLAAPQGPSTLHALLSKQGLMPQDSYGQATAADQTQPLTFSSFRPTTTPAERLSRGGLTAGDDAAGSGASRPGSSTGLSSPLGAGKLPGIPGLVSPPPGFSVRQPRAAAPFAGIPGHGHPALNSPAVTSPFLAPHVFASRSMAQTAGIAKPEALGAPSGHVLRRSEMLEAERAKLRLAAAHVAVPRGTLERALVAPEIRFPEERAGSHPSAGLTTGPLAVGDLPTPFFGLPENPFGPEKKGKKKGKKGKGSKKKK